MWIEENLTTTPLPVEKSKKAHEVTTNGIVKAGNLKYQGQESSQMMKWVSILEEMTAWKRIQKIQNLNSSRIGKTQAWTATVEKTANIWRGRDLETSFFHKRENIFLSNSENNTKGNLSDGCVKYTVAPAGGENNYYFNILILTKVTRVFFKRLTSEY